MLHLVQDELRRPSYVKVDETFVVHRDLLESYDWKRPTGYHRLDRTSFQAAQAQLVAHGCQAVPESPEIQELDHQVLQNGNLNPPPPNSMGKKRNVALLTAAGADSSTNLDVSWLVAASFAVYGCSRWILRHALLALRGLLLFLADLVHPPEPS